MAPSLFHPPLTLTFQLHPPLQFISLILFNTTVLLMFAYQHPFAATWARFNSLTIRIGSCFVVELSISTSYDPPSYPLQAGFLLD
jgi:hypothetical protein